MKFKNTWYRKITSHEKNGKYYIDVKFHWLYVLYLRLFKRK